MLMHLQCQKPILNFAAQLLLVELHGYCSPNAANMTVRISFSVFSCRKRYFITTRPSVLLKLTFFGLTSFLQALKIKQKLGFLEGIGYII